MQQLEVWGGVECTVTRIGDRYVDQLVATGHHDRLDDLDRFAALGVRALRMPVLWERTAPRGLADADWSWADARLARLRELGIRPIVGLLHHGTGPADTSLLDDALPMRLAEFAGAVAARYPWVEDFTPVNEPLTTARFCALYGHWYPHASDDRSFAQALLVQIEAISRAMTAIRAVTPTARLVQTEDLAWIRSTPDLAYQADFENERRWLSFDLLCGRVDGSHPLAGYLRAAGADDSRLARIAAAPCPPDLVGVNYYVTSERFLDGDAAAPAGGNGRDRYDDIAAVHRGGLRGLAALLAEIWERYRLPIAITEAHLGCTRDEQMRWLLEIWDAAAAGRAGGADVRAVTAWALLGTLDWDSLCTEERGHYDPGAFDIRGTVPRATALARAIRALAAGERPDHPVLAGRGWWRR